MDGSRGSFDVGGIRYSDARHGQVDHDRFVGIVAGKGISSPLLFAETADGEQADKLTRDPVAPVKRSKSAQDKAASHTLHDGQSDGQPVHSFATLMAELATIVRNTCRTPHAGPDSPTFNVLTIASPHHQRALALINAIHL